MIFYLCGCPFFENSPVDSFFAFDASNDADSRKGVPLGCRW